jgi:hypothetical protein
MWFRSELARLATRLARLSATFAGSEVMAVFTSAAPNPQTALDLFKGEWASSLPAPYEQLQAGTAPLFTDPRVRVVIERLGGIEGKRVIELGPLEGGHSYMLDRAGAREVVAIEANSRAFLKCLVTKELLGMPSVRFQHGDFIAYLRTLPERADLVLASGVLYHTVNPVELIARIAATSDTAFFWTHYYDERLFSGNYATADRVVRGTTAEYDGYVHHLYRYDYRAALAWKGFCGGSRPYANWLSREDILGALRLFGLTELEIRDEQLDHPHGPALSVLARRP